MSRSRTIDVHAHFLPTVYRHALQEAGLETLDGGIPVPDWSPEEALALMDEVGIDGALLSISSPHVSFVDAAKAVGLCRSINDSAAEIRREHSRRFGAYAILPLQDITATYTEVERALDQLELDGIALPTHVGGHYLGDPRLRPLLEILDERRATVFIHPTSPTCFEAFGLELPAPMIEFPFDTTRTAASLLFSGALARHRHVNFILPHGGGTLPLLSMRIAALGSRPVLGDRAVPLPQTMDAFARFFYDTALSFLPHQIAALRALAPISQVLYGSDFPFANADVVRIAESTFANLPFTPAEQELVRHGNAARLFPRFDARCHASA